MSISVNGISRKLYISAIAAGMIALSPRFAQATYVGIPLYEITTPSNMIATLVSDQPGAIGGGAVVGGGFSSTAPSTPLVWNTSRLSNLLPAGFTGGMAYGTDGSYEVGKGFGPATGDSQGFDDGTMDHALLWTAGSNIAVDLNPNGFTDTVAYGVSNGQQVGFGWGTVTGGANSSHALLWTGTAASVVDLNPASAGADADTYAVATDGVNQVGYAWLSDEEYHPFLWSGTAASAVDLTPTNLSFLWSRAQGVGGQQQVGYGETTTADIHALLWTGSGASAVDLNPGNWAGSYALGTNGTIQVGYVWDGTDFAEMWSGSADSAVRLDQFLPAGGDWGSSQANGVDAAGDIYGMADGTVDGISGEYAVVWVQVPEPAGLGLVLGLGLLMLRRRGLHLKR